MNRLAKLTIVYLLSFSVCFGQSGDRKFVGKLILLDGGKKPVSNVSVRLIDEGAGVTGTDGKFTIAISNKSTTVTLELVNSDLAIIYPARGIAKVPKDQDELIEFYIGDSPKEVLTKALAKSNNDLKNNLIQMGAKQDGIEETLNAYRAEIQKMTDIKIADLKNQMDLESRRDTFYPTLAAAINSYINEAKDVKDVFKFTAKNAFDDPQALQLLTDAINSYNVVYEELNKNHNGYERTVSELWDSESKSNEVKELFSYALGELHSANIFTLNLSIGEINEYFRGDVKGSKKAFKETIIHDIQFAVLQLERRLAELDNRAHIVLSRLAA